MITNLNYFLFNSVKERLQWLHWSWLHITDTTGGEQPSLHDTPASVTSLHGVMSARRDIINASQSALLPRWCRQWIPDQSQAFRDLLMPCRVRGLKDVLHSQPVQWRFTAVTKEDLSPFVQQKVSSHLENKPMIVLERTIALTHTIKFTFRWPAESYIYLVDIPQQIWWEIGKVPVVSFVLRVPQHAVKPHHVGVGRAEAKAPVDLQQPSVFNKEQGPNPHTENPFAPRGKHSVFKRIEFQWVKLIENKDLDLFLWVQDHIEGATGLLQPDLSSR